MKTIMFAIITACLLPSFAFADKAVSSSASFTEAATIITKEDDVFTAISVTGPLSELGYDFGIGTSKGTKCYICNGTPRTCYEVSCDDILIVETDD